MFFGSISGSCGHPLREQTNPPWENHFQICLRRFLTCSLKEQPRMRLRCFAMKAAPENGGLPVRTGWESTENGGHYGKNDGKPTGKFVWKEVTLHGTRKLLVFPSGLSTLSHQKPSHTKTSTCPKRNFTFGNELLPQPTQLSDFVMIRKRPFILSQEKIPLTEGHFCIKKRSLQSTRDKDLLDNSHVLGKALEFPGLRFSDPFASTFHLHFTPQK